MSSGPTTKEVTGSPLDLDTTLETVKSLYRTAISTGQPVGTKMFIYQSTRPIMRIDFPRITDHDRMIESIIHALTLIPSLSIPTVMLTMDVFVELDGAATSGNAIVAAVISGKRVVLNVTWPYEANEDGFSWTDDEVSVGAETYPSQIEHALSIMLKAVGTLFLPSLILRTLHDAGFEIEFYDDWTAEKLDQSTNSTYFGREWNNYSADA